MKLNKDLSSSLFLPIFFFMCPLIYVMGARERHSEDQGSSLILNFQKGLIIQETKERAFLVEDIICINFLL